MPLSYKRKIYYHDTDCGGVVYYGNYLKFLEEARTHVFEQLGLSVRDLAEKEDTLFVVARQEIDYRSPAVYGQTLDIKTWVEEIGRVKIWFGYEIKDPEGKVIVTARTLMVCVDPSIKKKRVPEHIAKILGDIMVKQNAKS
ncbi:MAG: thioesterase family protein [Candidatus Margulisiibacteriota bacterium]